jgi:drug/metabolite transporter (DMT)-like permease
VLLATILYGFNVNIASVHLKEIPSTIIAAIAFGSLVPLSLVVLYYTGFFELPLGNSDLLISTGASTILGVFGTAIATILFYILLKRAGAIFASMVTYGIPFVALAWGLAAGESIQALQVVGLSIILVGVYRANK